VSDADEDHATPSCAHHPLSLGATVTTPAASVPPGYGAWLTDLKTRIRDARVHAALAVNRELIDLYWRIDRDIQDRQAGVVQIRVTRETWNPLAGAALATLGVTHKPPVLNHAPDGARTWGFIASATGVGGIAGGLLVLRVRLSQSLLGVQVATALLATPLIMLALHAPVPLLALSSGTFGVVASRLWWKWPDWLVSGMVMVAWLRPRGQPAWDRPASRRVFATRPPFAW